MLKPLYEELVSSQNLWSFHEMDIKFSDVTEGRSEKFCRFPGMRYRNQAAHRFERIAPALSNLDASVSPIYFHVVQMPCSGCAVLLRPKHTFRTEMCTFACRKCC